MSEPRDVVADGLTGCALCLHCGIRMGDVPLGTVAVCGDCTAKSFKLEIGSETHDKLGVLVFMLVSCAFDKEDDGWIGVRPGAIWAESIDVLKNTIETVIHDLCVDCDSNAELLLELSRWYLDCDKDSERLFGSEIKSQLRVTIDGDVVLDIDTVN